MKKRLKCCKFIEFQRNFNELKMLFYKYLTQDLYGLVDVAIRYKNVDTFNSHFDLNHKCTCLQQNTYS